MWPAELKKNNNNIKTKKHVGKSKVMVFEKGMNTLCSIRLSLSISLLGF